MLCSWSGMILFLALAHMLDATQLVRGGWGGMITFLALAHMLDATQLVGDDNIPCTCTHVGCTIGRAFGHMIYSFAWRKSLGPRTGAQFLEELSRVW